MKWTEMTEALGLGLVLIALACMVYAVWIVSGPAAWFGGGALLLLLGFVLIGIANRGTK